jgi:hypothetical protein
LHLGESDLVDICLLLGRVESGDLAVVSAEGAVSRAIVDLRAPVVELHLEVGTALGVEGSAGGKPQLAGGRILDVSAVVWATGYRPDFRWIDLPIFDAGGAPIHHRGVVAAAPGLYFLGLHFLHTPTSAHIGGVGKDARHLARHLAAHSGTAQGRPAHHRVRPPSAGLA